eukprot:5633402-Amphidinium_carterae.1
MQVHLLQLWVSYDLLWLQGEPEACRSTTANTGGEEKFSVLPHEALGAVGAPTRFRKKTRELPLQDQRAKLTAQIKRLAAAVDKQHEVLTTAQTKFQELRRELATAHVDLAQLPQDVLPAPKKISMTLLEPSVINLMKFVQGQSQQGNLEATALLQECVADIESASPPTEPLLVPQDADVDMVEEEGLEPSAKKKKKKKKKKKGMGAGTPLSLEPPQAVLALTDAQSTSLPSQGAEFKGRRSPVRKRLKKLSPTWRQAKTGP